MKFGRRKWTEYAAGFGHLEAEHWLGLNKTHYLTTRRLTASLRVDMSDFDGNTKYVLYRFFNVGKPGNKYRLSVLGYSGTAGDSLSYHNRMAFSTYDQDNDEDSSSNSARWGNNLGTAGGWWHKKHIITQGSPLNGAYKGMYGHTWFGGLTALRWYKFSNPLKYAEMKIKWN